MALSATAECAAEEEQEARPAGRVAVGADSTLAVS